MKKYLLISLMLCVLPAQSHSIKPSTGLLFGYASDFLEEAIEGYPHTEFNNSNVLGLSIMIPIERGRGLELLVERYEQQLVEWAESELDYGKLKSNPFLLLFKYYTIPKQNKGLFLNFDIGAGVNVSSFEKGNFFKQFEQMFPDSAKWIMSTDASPIFEIGLGIGYFLSRHVSVSFDCKIMINKVRTYWTLKNLQTNESDTIKEELNASTYQPMLALRYWF